MLLQIVRQPTEAEMHRLIDKIEAEGITREEARQFNRPESAPRRSGNYTYRFQPDSKEFQFTLKFNKPEVDKEELIKALRAALERLLSEE
jgi:hypothetical protein